MVIPADLSALVASVVWMLGTWEGWGMYAALAALGQEEPTEDSPVIEETRGDVADEQMRLVTHVYTGVASGPTDPMRDAAKGLFAIRKDGLISKEIVHVSIAPSDVSLPPLGQYNSREFITTSASTEDHSTVWDGVSVGSCVRIVSDTIVLGAGATRVMHLSCIFGLVTGELTRIQKRTLNGKDEVDAEISGHFMCITQASTGSGEVIEGVDDIQGGLLV